MKRRVNKKLRWVMTICIAVLIFTLDAYGGTQRFEEVTWELVSTVSVTNSFLGNYWLQSMVRVEDELIIIENDAISGNPDVVRKYQWVENEDGKGSYELIQEVKEHDYEHANGMTYNPDTDRIYVAYTTASTDDVIGSIAVMNPSTLQFEKTIKVFDDRQVSSIDYDRYTQTYVVMSGAGNLYTFDQNFENMQEAGYIDPYPGQSFQDFVVSGDYVVALPVDTSQSINNYVLVYSLSKKETIATLTIQCHDGELEMMEGEGLIKLSEGEFQIGVIEPLSNGQREIHFYQMSIPYVADEKIEEETTQSVSQNTISENTAPISMTENKGDGGQNSDPELSHEGEQPSGMKVFLSKITTQFGKFASNSMIQRGFLFCLVLILICGTVFWSLHLERIRKKRKSKKLYHAAQRKRLQMLFHEAEMDIERYEQGESHIVQ